LLSLRTPSTSFEENKPGRAPPLSPEGPPKIQNAHQQRGDQPLLFEVRRRMSVTALDHLFELTLCRVHEILATAKSKESRNQP
jgi:hypothetical protein